MDENYVIDYACTDVARKNEVHTPYFDLVDLENENVSTTTEQNKYEYVDHPTHYNNYSVEVIDMFEKIYGAEATALWCEMTALKYRLRMGTKPDNSIKQDLDKEKWYLNKKNELLKKIK